jgi:hypothetical protein
MQISIWDLDWYHNRNAMPNIQCMQLSSYCKQQGYMVNFVTKEEHILLNCDRLYIFREEESTPMPQRSIIDKTTTRLVGKGFKYFNTTKLSPVVMACRPDYLLYDSGKYANCNFIQFFDGNTLIKNRQDFHNTLQKKKFTIVTDNNLWKQKIEDIIWCLKCLKNERNIMFKHSISLEKLLNNEDIAKLFLQLHFATGTEFKWRNDYSSSDVEPIIEFLQQLKKHTKSRIGFIPIRAIVDNDSNLDVYRCFNVIYKFKCAKLHCKIISPSRCQSIFKHLAIWTDKHIELSFVEYTLHNYVANSGMLWYNILNNSIHWRNARIDILLLLLTNSSWSESQHLLFSQWGDDSLSNRNVDYNYIKERINLIYKDIDDE